MPLPVKNTVSDIRQFLLSQYFYDGLKITFGVILPSVICYQFNLLELGITFSVGALYVSITDNPGPVLHKRNAMLAANGFIFITALLIGLTNRNPYLLPIDLVVLCFFYSMFNVYGVRASAVGVAALLTVITGIDQHLDTEHTLLHASCLLGGGLWYMLFSLLLTRTIPYRAAEQTLGECMDKIAGYIRIKAGFYDTKNKQEEVQEDLIRQQILVYQQLDNVREILFKTRQVLKDSSTQGNKLLRTFIDVVDLYEMSMESHDDYTRIRTEFADTAILEKYQYIILNMARELEQAALAIHNHQDLDNNLYTPVLLDDAFQSLEQLDKNGRNTLVLKKIFVNLKSVAQRMEQIYAYQQKGTKVPMADRANLDRFVTHKIFDAKQFVQNLSFKSAIFRHALRLTLVCVAAFFFARHFYTGHHSYWILLTIIVILKPGFSQTRQRNIERIVGTLAGGLLGILILYFFKDVSVRFWLLLLFMLLSYSFVRIRYVISVFFMTPFVLIMFSFIGHNNDMLIVKERVIDTFIGAGIAALASYFILPTWESAQIRQMMGEVVKRNMAYLQSVAALQQNGSQHLYKLARKEMYVSASNLASAFQRMLNEPKRKRQNVNETNKFILLNNLFASYAAALAQKAKEGMVWNENDQKELKKILHISGVAYEQLSGKTIEESELIHPSNEKNVSVSESSADPLLQQLTQISNDIKKVATTLTEV